jgi:hypothetical protein
LQLWNELQEKTHSWAECLLAARDLKFEFSEALEVLRTRYVTTTLVARWFNQIQPEIAATQPFLLFDFDEVMVVAACDKTVFRRKESKGPHVTMAVSQCGDGPPPLFVFPGLTQVTQFAELEAIGKLQVLNSPKG